MLLLLAPLHAQQRRTINDIVSTRPKYSINDVVSRKRSAGRPRVGRRRTATICQELCQGSKGCPSRQRRLCAAHPTLA